jgi:AcrR family transcriptional regulator
MAGTEAASEDTSADPLREQLLDAAARVFAAKGYSGTKVMDIVREAGLSAGAMYGRFDSKRELLTEAVVTRAVKLAREAGDDIQIAELIAQFAVRNQGPLRDSEALQLEAYVTARREPEVATALRDSRQHRRLAVEPLVQQALEDGTLAPGVDIPSVLYFLETVNLGLLLQRSAGIAPPDEQSWSQFVRRMLEVLAAGTDEAPKPGGPVGRRRRSR